MAQGKKSFIAYVDWKETFDSLPDDMAGKLIKHLFAYVNDENPISDSLLIRAVFANIKTTLKRDLKKYETIKEKRVEAGRLGGIKSGEARREQNEANEANASKTKQNEANEAVSVNDNVNDNEYNNKAHKKDKNIRELEFRKEASTFTTYPQTMIDEFCDYWTESNKDGVKMKYEMQKIFDLSRRLATWNRNNFKKPAPKQETPDKLIIRPLKYDTYVPE